MSGAPPRQRLSLRGRLLFSLSAVVVVPLVIVSIYTTSATLESMHNLALSDAHEFAADHARRIEDQLSGVEKTLLQLNAQSESRATLDFERALESTLQDPTRLIRSVLLLDQQGRELLHFTLPDFDHPEDMTSVRESLQDHSDEEFFRHGRVLEPGAIDWSPHESGAMVTALLYDQMRRPGSVLALQIEPTQLMRSDTCLEAALLDWHGRLHAGSPRLAAHPKALELLQQHNRGISEAVVTGAGRLLISAPVRGKLDAKPMMLVRLTDASKWFERVNSFKVVFSLLLTGALLFALVLSWWLARQLTGPLSTLSRGTRLLARGELSTPIDVRTGDEIEALAHDFNAMAGQLTDLLTSLEHKVAQKTEELVASNRSLSTINERLNQELEQRRRLEAQLIQSEKLSSIGVLAAGLAHEVNNPVGIISMYAQMLLEKLPAQSQERGKLTTIREQADRIAKITSNLLTFSRKGGGVRRRVEMSRMLDDTLTLLEGRLRKDDISVTRRYAPRLPQVEVDESQCQQVFLNLILNALQAMNGKGTLTLTTCADTKWVSATIADTGPGIPHDIRTRIFEPFFTTKAPGQGTGLGLSISYGIIEAHGGKLELASTSPAGTTFRVDLPIAGTPSTTEGQRS